MCVSALILSKGDYLFYEGLAEVVMQGCYTGPTLPNCPYMEKIKVRIMGTE